MFSRSVYLKTVAKIAVSGVLSYGLFISVAASANSTGGLESLTNQQRISNGLNALNDDQRLDAAASNKAADMIAKNYWSHFSPTGVSPVYWFMAAGYSYVYAGENLSQGYNTDSAVVSAWMASADHRANILNASYRDMGCGMANGSLQGVVTLVTVCMYGATAQAPAPVVVAEPPAASSNPTPISHSSRQAIAASAPIESASSAEPAPTKSEPVKAEKPKVLAKTSQTILLLHKPDPLDQIEILTQMLIRERTSSSTHAFKPTSSTLKDSTLATLLYLLSGPYFKASEGLAG